MKPQINRILLLQFLLLALSTITAIQKISAAGVPDWFVKKFEPTFNFFEKDFNQKNFQQQFLR